MFGENLAIAFRALWANKMRSLLTTLGVVIGVAAVIAVVSVVQGLFFAVNNLFKDLGAGWVRVMAERPVGPEWEGKIIKPLYRDDAEYLLEHASMVEGVAPAMFFGGVTIKNGDRRSDTTVLGTVPGYMDVVSFYVDRGRFFTALDDKQRRKVCVIGANIIEKIDLDEPVVGRHMQIGSENFTIIGIMETRGELVGLNLDDYIFIPYSTARGMYGEEQIFNTIWEVSVNDPERMELAKSQIIDVMRRRRKLSGKDANDFQLLSQEQVTSVLGTFSGYATGVAGGIAGVAIVKAALLVAHLECHQRAAIRQVDAAPVPAARLGRHIGARPFVVEPRAALHVLAIQLARDLEVRAAVVVACLAGPVPFPAEAPLALQHQLSRQEAELEIKLPGNDARLVAVTLQLQPPVVDPHAGAAELGLREREAGARRALVVQQASARRVAQRGMREQHLLRVEAARVGALLLRPRAEERDLEAEAVLEPAGDVPPLDAKLGMRAVIARKDEPRVGRHIRIAHAGRPSGGGQEREPHEGAAAHGYQSSRTARTGAMPVASRPASSAVSTASAMSSTMKPASSRYGGCSSMLQLNDCRFTT
jgi:putative ABC transport system permease protein